jgi:hypothetical protein
VDLMAVRSAKGEGSNILSSAFSTRSFCAFKSGTGNRRGKNTPNIVFLHILIIYFIFGKQALKMMRII